MGGPLTITIYPVGFHAKSGQIVTVTVKDSGTKPISVVGISTVLSPKPDGCKIAAAPNILTFSPVGFALKPGQSHRVKVKINSDPANHVGAMFAARTKGVIHIKGKGNAHLIAADVAQITLKGEPLVCSPPAPVRSSGLAPSDIALISVGSLVMALLITMLLIARRTHNRGKRNSVNER